MTIERLRQSSAEDHEDSSEKMEQVVDAIKAKLDDLAAFGGKTGEAAVPRYKNMLKKIEGGDQEAYQEALREFGLGEIEEGSQQLRSEGMEAKEISKEEKDEIEKHLDRFD